MPSEHVQRRKKFLESIDSKTAFNWLLEESMLNDTEKKFLEMCYLEKYDFNFIASELGYSEAGIIKMHNRVLKKIEALL